MTTPVSVVATWHEALNRGDVERLVELSRPDVEVGGPRGTGKGAQLLREWAARANIRLEPRIAFHKGNTVVVEQEAEWRSPETGELSGSQQIASVFMVARGSGRLPGGNARVWRRGPGALRTGGLRIRRYELGDKEAVWRLHNEALDAVGAHLGNGDWDDDLHRIRDAYLEAGGEFLVGVLDGRVVAMGALRRISHEEAEVKRMRVEPALQGRGYGRALLEALHRRAAGLGYSTLRLDTTVHQRAARSLYEASGYREARRCRIGPFDCVFYERKAVV